METGERVGGGKACATVCIRRGKGGGVSLIRNTGTKLSLMSVAAQLIQIISLQ